MWIGILVCESYLIFYLVKLKQCMTYIIMLIHVLDYYANDLWSWSNTQPITWRSRVSPVFTTYPFTSILSCLWCTTYHVQLKEGVLLLSDIRLMLRNSWNFYTIKQTMYQFNQIWPWISLIKHDHLESPLRLGQGH